MNQTNRLAANATNPPNLGSPSYTTFTNNNINPGGGNIMGGPGFGPESGLGMGTYDSGYGEGATQSGAGISGGMQFDQGLGLGSGSAGGGHLGFEGSMGGDAYDDYLAEQESDFNQLMEQGVFTLPDGSGYVISNMTNLYGDIWEQAGLNSSTFNTPEEALEAITLLQSLQQLNEQGFYEDPSPGASYDLDLDFGSGFGSGGFDFNISGVQYEGWQDAYDEYQQSFIDAQQQAPTFAGGSGQGGQTAKRLYYPGTSGGFASVGSGIGGGNNTLQELLKGLG